MLCEARYPLAADTRGDDIRALLRACPEFRPTSTTSWSWVDTRNGAAKPPAAGSEHGEPSQESLTNGALALGEIRLDGDAGATSSYVSKSQYNSALTACRHVYRSTL